MTTQAANIAALAPGLRPDVASAIRQASAQTGVDFAYLLEQAAVESSFDPQAQAQSSSARGLYQFVDRTWLDVMDRHGAAHGYPNVAKAITRDAAGNPVVANESAQDYILALRDNPRISALMAAEFAQDNKVTLEHELGRQVAGAELYMAHFLGAGGAAKFLHQLETNGAEEASTVLPEAARANAGVFYRDGRALSLEQVFAHFEDRFGNTTETQTAAVAAAQSAAWTNSAEPAPNAAIFAAAAPALAAGQELPGVLRDKQAELRAELALQLLAIQAFTDRQEPEADAWTA